MRDLKKFLNENISIQIDEQKKNKTIENLKIEIDKIDIQVKENYLGKVKRYIPFLSKKTIIFQSILLILGISIITSVGFEKTRLILSTVMPVLVLLQMIELEKSFKYNMYEIEISCKLNLKELILIKLIIYAFINLCFMTIFAIVAGSYFKYSISLLILYFLVPFMITNAINIGIIRMLKSKSNELISFISMIFVNAILVIIDIKFPYVYETSNTLIWAVLLIIAIYYFVKNVYEIYEKEEDFIWNLQ